MTPRTPQTAGRQVASAVSIATLALMAAAPQKAAAQAAPQRASSQGSVEEVVVTARKREESLQSVPVAITAMSGEQLAERGIQSPLDLGRSVPSLRSLPHSISASVVTFSLRGQMAGDVLSTVDQAVGVYVDGVYIARPRGLNGAFFDLERVEVLKGPQGTLYGRNTTGGAINLISRAPDYDGVHGFVSADAGKDKLLSGRFAVNIPIIQDKLTLRIGAQRTTRDGMGESVITGQDIGYDKNQTLIRGSLRADPTNNVRVDLKGEWYRSREVGFINVPRNVDPLGVAPFEAAIETGALTPAGLGRIFGGTPTAADLAGLGAGLAALQRYTTLGGQDPFRTYYESDQHDWFEGYTLGGTIAIDLSDNVQLKSVTGYRHFLNEQVFDLDGTPFRILEVGMGHFPDVSVVQGAPGQPLAPFQIDPGPEQRDKFFSQEFNLSGQAWDGRLNWLGGLYYSKETGSDTQHAQAFPAILPNTFVHDGHRILNASWSMYSQNDFKLTDQLTVTFGGRYTEERKGLASRSRNFFWQTNTITCLTGVPGTFPASNPDACLVNNEKTFTGFSYLGSLNWQVTPDTLVYVKTAKGFRGGAFQLRSPTLAPAGPETARDIEVGFKKDWLDHRIRTNLAAYTTKYTNKQENIIVVLPGGGSATIIQNAADATLRGFEGEFTAKPIEGLTLNATVAYVWGKYNKFPGAIPVDNSAPVDASGERFSNPPWTYSLSGRYQFPVGPGTLALQADWAWTDHAHPPPRLINPALPEALVNEFVASCQTGSCQDGRASLGLLNARIDYEVEDLGATVSVFMTNVLDKKWQVPGPDAASLGGLQYGITGEPRLWGVTVRKTFGSGA